MREDSAVWEELEYTWNSFWKKKGKQRLEPSNRAYAEGIVNCCPRFFVSLTDPPAEMFWIDIELSNPLNTAISLTSLTATVSQKGSSRADIAVETVNEITLDAKESRVVGDIAYDMFMTFDR
jgi:hypothetical protein